MGKQDRKHLRSTDVALCTDWDFFFPQQNSKSVIEETKAQYYAATDWAIPLQKSQVTERNPNNRRSPTLPQPPRRRFQLLKYGRWSWPRTIRGNQVRPDVWSSWRSRGRMEGLKGRAKNLGPSAPTGAGGRRPWRVTWCSCGRRSSGGDRARAPAMCVACRRCGCFEERGSRWNPKVGWVGLGWAKSLYSATHTVWGYADLEFFLYI